MTRLVTISSYISLVVTLILLFEVKKLFEIGNIYRDYIVVYIF